MHAKWNIAQCSEFLNNTNQEWFSDWINSFISLFRTLNLRATPVPRSGPSSSVGIATG